MALAFTTISNRAVANRRQKVVEITWDNSYPTGGEAVTAANFGLKKIEHITHGIAISSDRTTACPIAWDRTNSKLVAYESGASGAVLPEKGNTESLASYTSIHTVTGF